MAWKDSGDCRGVSGRHAGEGPEGAVRAAGLRLRRLAAHGRGLRRARQARRAPRSCARRRRRCSSASTRRSGTRSSASTPSRSTATRSKVLTVASNPGHCLWSGIVPPERAARVVAAADAAGHVESAGASARCRRSTRPSTPTTIRPARSGRTTTRIIALGFKRYGFARRGGGDRARHLRRGQPFPAQPAAGALCRHAARRHEFPGAVSRRQRAAGLGRRLGLRAAAGDARHLPGRAARPALRRSRSCRTGCPT